MRMQSSFSRNLFTSSPHLTPIQLPSPNETHLWYVKPYEVKSQALLEKYMEILSPAEKENVLRMAGDEHKKTALLSRALARTTIARYQISSAVDPRFLKFRKNKYGKPEVEWQHSDHWKSPPLHFNVSHTNSLVACGVTGGSPIGIDVEGKLRAVRNNVLSLAQRYLSGPEFEFLSSIKDSEAQRQEFIKLWTMKEAYVKALGVGFSGSPFKTFTLRFRRSSERSSLLSLNSDYRALETALDQQDHFQKIMSYWQFELIELDGSHYAAICTKKGEGSKSMKVWKTIPFQEDVCVSGTHAVVELNDLV